MKFSIAKYLIVPLTIFLSCELVLGQTPDGETPASERICDGLKDPGVTHGLYGLCVAYCEAQDLNLLASTTPTNGEGLLLSAPPMKLLEIYNRRKSADDPQMPCIGPPTEITVTSASDSGDGSLRQALEDIAIGGTIRFDPALTGGTIPLTSGPLVPGSDVMIDASAAPELSIDGGAVDRVLIVDAGLTVNVSQLTMTNGYGYQLAGCVLNFGNLTLDHVTVTSCLMTTDAGDFWQGGAGIYNGEGAGLVLVDSTVSNNSAAWSGGGIYSYFGSSTSIIRSTISGNISNDVGGGLRLLSDAYIENSTFSGNETTGWYGGALFLTDGALEMVNSTVVDNVSPLWAPAAVFVGTFNDSSASLTLMNSILARNTSDGCFAGFFGSGAVILTADHHNVFTDTTCAAGGSDLVVSDAGIDVLGDNGGPTLTHALLSGSPAIGTADPDVCPPTDQRGIERDSACDVGAFEY